MLKTPKFRNRGFTILEVLLVIVIIAVLSAIVAPIYQFSKIKNDLLITTNTITEIIRRTELLSQAMDGDSTWGIKILPGIVTVFKGADYASRDTNYDEKYDISGSIIPSGQSEFIFSKLTGYPTVTGSIILTSVNGETTTITINAKGTASY